MSKLEKRIIETAYIRSLSDSCHIGTFIDAVSQSLGKKRTTIVQILHNLQSDGLVEIICNYRFRLTVNGEIAAKESYAS